MQVELTGLDRATFHRACAQLDNVRINYAVIGTRGSGLLFKSEDAQACINFVHYALRDPNAKSYR